VQVPTALKETIVWIPLVVISGEQVLATAEGVNLTGESIARTSAKIIDNP
jgi:hypothetical protein